MHWKILTKSQSKLIILQSDLDQIREEERLRNVAQITALHNQQHPLFNRNTQYLHIKASIYNPHTHKA